MDRFAHSFITCEIYDGGNIVFPENFTHGILIADVRLIKLHASADNFFHSSHRFFLTVVKVIRDDYVVTVFNEFYSGVGTNISRAAGNQNSFHYIFSFSVFQPTIVFCLIIGL